MLNFIKKEDSKSLIIFIHGFTGSEETWKNNSGKSFSELLLEDMEIKENFDVAHFTYYTKFIEKYKINRINSMINTLFKKNYNKVKKNLEVDEISEYLNSVIKYNCEDYDNIVLVGHSMGGLVSKYTILKDIENDKKIKLFISLAVPHNGATLASYANILIKNNVQINNLEPLNTSINYLNNKWINQEILPKALYIIGQFDDVVPKTSSIPYTNQEKEIVYCDEDHISIAKPENKFSLVYVSVIKTLKEFLKANYEGDKKKIKKFSDDGRYDKELFVLKLLLAKIHKPTITNAKQTFYNAEYMIRNLSTEEIEQLEEIYIKLEMLYNEHYSEFLNGEINENELILNVHKSIRSEHKEFLRCLIPYINELHKTGMMHQIANDDKGNIWWSKEKALK